MKTYKPLDIPNKLKGNYFFLPCDTVYFNEFAKYFICSVEKNARDIPVHCHIFDASEKDIKYCNDNKISYTTENTPTAYDTLDKKKGYWVNVRFCRIPEIFDNSATILAVDPDGVVVNNISLSEFKNDTQVDWVAMREKGHGSLGGCQSFTSNGTARHLLKKHILDRAEKINFVWFMDQDILDEMVAQGEIGTYDMKYVDYFCRKESKIWTGKGARKYFREGAKPGKNKFASKLQEFKNLQ